MTKIQIKRGIKKDISTLDEGELGFVTDTEEVFVGTGSNNVKISNNDIVYIQDRKPSGTNGGTFTAGDWRTRDLNNVENSQSWCVLSSNQITLDAGTYRIRAHAVASGSCNGHKARLQNITDGTTSILGSTEFGLEGSGHVTHSHVMGQITITAQKTFEIQHRSQDTGTTNGFGRAAGFGDEIYVQVEIEKIS